MRLYNSLTKAVEEFKPFENKTVKMYVCGITPYDTTHLGHAFTYIFFDALQRYLKYKGYEVIYTQNVTDIDDDILKKAKETNQNWKELGDFWTNKYLSDMKTLNVEMPTHYIKATETIDKIIEIIRNLLKKGYAYVKEGNVYFDVNKFQDYGRLSHFSKDQMLVLAKERGGYPDDPRKKNPLDFILWQSASWRTKQDEPAWPSPWGSGRPGWHIECSAIINKYLGNQIDIHGGGRDLIFPHHESEIAQSESYTQEKPFVKYWAHTAMLIYQGEKMSKSLGNLIMVDDLLKKYSPSAIRYTLLSHHYRIPWEFDEMELTSAQKIVEKFKKALDKKSNGSNILNSEKYLKEFESFMDDDINTPKALNLAHFLAEVIIREKNINTSNLQQILKTVLQTLGFKA